MTSTGLLVFEALCQAGDTIAAAREPYGPGTDAWCALTELLQGVDALIDQVVTADAIEEEDDDA